MIDIIDRLRFDATRCEIQFSKGIALNISEAADEIERLRAALKFYAKQENYMEVRGPAGLHSYKIKGAEVMGDRGKTARDALNPSPETIG